MTTIKELKQEFYNLTGVDTKFDSVLLYAHKHGLAQELMHSDRLPLTARNKQFWVNAVAIAEREIKESEADLTLVTPSQDQSNEFPNPELLDDSQLETTVLSLNSSLLSTKNILENMDRLDMSAEFGVELDNIIRRVSYLYILTDACAHYDRIDSIKGAKKFARLGAVHAYNDFYYNNNKTFLTIEKYLKRGLLVTEKTRDRVAPLGYCLVKSSIPLRDAPAYPQVYPLGNPLGLAATRADAANRSAFLDKNHRPKNDAKTNATPANNIINAPNGKKFTVKSVRSALYDKGYSTEVNHGNEIMLGEFSGSIVVHDIWLVFTSTALVESGLGKMLQAEGYSKRDRSLS